MMKQLNAIIASALVSGLLLVGMLGIGVNALTSTTAAATDTVPAGILASSSVRASRRSGEQHTRTTTGGTDDSEIFFTQ